MLKISRAGCLGLSPAISSQLTLEVCVAAKKFDNTPSFGGLRSFKVNDIDKTKKPVFSACYDKQHICTYLQRFHTRQANSGKITFYLAGYRYLSLTPSFEGNPVIQGDEILSRKTSPWGRITRYL